MISADAQTILIEKAIRAAGGKQSLLAARLECAQQTVSKLLKAEIQVTADWALRLARATDNQVPASAWYPEFASPPTAPDAQPERAA